MKFLSRFFNSKPAPAPVCTDAVLGEMHWSDDEDGWLGILQGQRFSIARDVGTQPSEMVLDYARSVLRDRVWLEGSLREAKRRFLADLPSGLEAEVEGLRFGQIHFFARKETPSIIADLEGGDDPRCWRVEFTGRNCEGIGFDT